MSTRSRIRQAFTLVELLVVIGIIAQACGACFSRFKRPRRRASPSPAHRRCAKIGMAMQMYVSDWKGTYPPCWIQDDKTFSPPNAYVGQAGKNRSYVTLLRKYLAIRNDDAYQGGDAKIFTCPNDSLERASWLGGGALSLHDAIQLGAGRYLLQTAVQRIPKRSDFRHDAESRHRAILERAKLIPNVDSFVHDQTSVEGTPAG